MIRRQWVAATFGAAVNDYEQRAEVQRHAARQLGKKLEDLSIPEHPLVLELGCGSGFLSHYLLNYRPEGRFLLSDLSSDMVRAVQRQVGKHKGRRWYAVMDGERPAVAGGFDLIAAGLTWQWFEDPLGSLIRLIDLLRPGGCLLFSTLGESTFREWRAACAQGGISCGILLHPGRSFWEQNWPKGGQGFLEEEIFLTRHPSALEFLQSLQAIGANRPAPTHQPVRSGALRRVLRMYSQEFTVSYHLFYILFHKTI